MSATISGGKEIVSRTGVASGTSVLGHGSQTDLGKTVATVLFGGTEIVSSGGTASNTTVYSGGSLLVLSHGVADPATVYSGGSETISKGGTDRGAQISGGIQIDSGLASGTVIFAGSQVVRSAGTAIGTAVSGGTEMVSSGGTTSNTLLVSGQETVLRGGHASGTIITSGGYELVSSGGNAVATKISGGTLDVAAGGSASGIVFSSGGMLQVDSGGHVSGAISGFHLGDEIDLRGLAYVSGSSTLSWKQKTSGANARGHLQPHLARAVWGQFRSRRGRPWHNIDHRSGGVQFRASDAFGGTPVDIPRQKPGAYMRLLESRRFSAGFSIRQPVALEQHAPCGCKAMRAPPSPAAKAGSFPDSTIRMAARSARPTR
jgi:autotransporter passenger strand-loop-strand repeat protein